jgi:PAS domain S-box-containing protein
VTLRGSRAWLIVFAAFVALALCGILYQRTQTIDLRAHAELERLLQHMQEVDSDLGKYVLASRYGLVNQYDGLTHSNAELDSSRAELRARLIGAVGEDSKTAHTVARLEQAARSMHADVEQFKTQNSVLKNSLFYLPVAGDSLAFELSEAHTSDGDLLALEVTTLVRSTLVYNLLKTGTLRESLLSQQDRLEANAGTVPTSTRPRFAQFLRHAQTLLRQQEVVDPLVARISSNTLSELSDQLDAQCAEHLELEEARVNRYRVALSSLVVLLVAALVAIAHSLRVVYANLEQQVLDRTRLLADEKVALEVAERLARLNEVRLNAIIEGAREGIVRLGPDGHVRSWNPAAAQLFESTWPQTQGKPFLTLAVPQESQETFLAWLTRVDTNERVDSADYWHEDSFVTGTGRVFLAECSAARRDPMLDDEVTLFIRDISLAKQMEAELSQAQKLESVGRLAAGIAHEINTPVQFVSDSCFFVGDAFQAMARLVAGYNALVGTIPQELRHAFLAEAAALQEEADLTYVLESTPKALETMVEGLKRVAELVAGMRNFAHPDQKEMVLVDLNQALKSTLTIARNEYKYVAELETDLADLPQVICHAREVNQVVLNIIVNSAHAIAEVVKGSDKKGLIRVLSRVDQDSVVISIADSGGGIPAEIQARIFDPFFTTKEVGRGTGQGLAIARSVIVEKHGGQLSFETELGKGTTFHVRLPIAGKASQARSAA